MTEDVLPPEQPNDSVSESDNPPPVARRRGRPRGIPNRKKADKTDVLLAEIARLKAQLDHTGEAVPVSSDSKAKDFPRSGAPPIPKEDPMAGDKTPAIVEWYRDNWPEEFERRYKKRLRKTHLRANIKRRRPEDDVYDEETGRREKMMQVSHEAGLNTEPRFY